MGKRYKIRWGVKMPIMEDIDKPKPKIRQDMPIKQDNLGKSSVTTEPILHEHLRRLMSDISTYIAEYKVGKLNHALQDLYTLIRPRLKGKADIIKDIEDKRDKAIEALSFTEEDVEAQCGFDYSDRLIMLRRKVYARALPIVLDFQASLYEQLYDLKLILGGGKDE